MPEQQVYICDKTEGIVDLAPKATACRKSVGDDPVVVSFSYEVNGVLEPTVNHMFCSVSHGNFWLKRQRIVDPSK